ncbi:MAG: FAD-binding and (Fe-S)-binding domain-containing protein [Neisseria sp.]|nr:FAD-binding and (Fe-S)-binding domain-containing protein [Neisseria sp.]
MPATTDFLNAVSPHFQGDIDTSDAARQVFSTDNSIYRLEPAAVVYPKNTEDLQLLAETAARPAFRSVVLTARGGGTGTNGQSLTDGIVVDLSRHMNRIIRIDPEKRTATVQAGVVKDQLNAALKPYGLFFAPELSTSNRATIGGMINTDASGQGSCRYGKTHHHVLQLKTVLYGGEVLESEALSADNWEQAVQHKSRQQQTLYHELYRLANDNSRLIADNFPKLNRSLTGYDLPNLLSDGIFNINSVLCGSEGSLGWIAEATLNLLPEPNYRVLVNIGYAGFQDALRDAGALMKLNPLSVETIDSKVLALAKNDFVWENVARYFPETTETIAGINLVELTADTQQELAEQQEAFLAHLAADNSVRRLSVTLAEGEAAIGHVYAMRKRAVGLLGNVPGEKRPLPFVEDTAVPPENLADYIAEFRALLDSMGLEYGMFGHVDAGVLHVRPQIDLKADGAAELIQTVSDRVTELTHRYGGVLWGEHGKGFRSEYAPIFFGQAYPLVQAVKALFDPNNQFNPGKIATPATLPASRLIRLTEIPLRGINDKQILPKDWAAFGNTMHCNGNGACFNFDVNDPMCPSYKATRDRIHSPKGRATLLKEWLRREAAGEQSNTFDQEVYRSLHGCLSCKSCSGQCPVKIDIPDSKARFLERYYNRHARSLRDYALAALENALPKLLPFRRIYNAVLRMPFFQTALHRLLGLRDTPLLHNRANTDFSVYGAIILSRQFQPADLAAVRNPVIIVQDAFTRFFDTDVMIDVVRFIAKLGFTPCLLPYMPSGKPLHVHGFLQRFERQKQHSLNLLLRAAETNIPMIGIEPAVTLMYRQEYRQTYGGHPTVPEIEVLMIQEWLHRQLPELADFPATATAEPYYLAAHCTERTQTPASTRYWQDIFRHFHIPLETLAVGCCGMSGTYGHEQEHFAVSEQIYRQSWQAKITEYNERVLATGFSCRCQTERFSRQTLLHPIQALLRALENN